MQPKEYIEKIIRRTFRSPETTFVSLTSKLWPASWHVRILFEKCFWI